MKRPCRRPEDAIQRAVFQHLARGVAGLVAIQVGIGGYRWPIRAQIRGFAARVEDSGGRYA